MLWPTRWLSSLRPHPRAPTGSGVSTRCRDCSAPTSPSFAFATRLQFAKRLGKFRLPRITKAVERFLGCGDYSKGIARIQCTNPDCRAEYFRPFSCSVFHLCPSCSQKRTLLLGEYMNEQLLLRLPHRQFVFTLPKVLRVFFRHHKRLHGEISRIVYGLVRDFTTAAAGRGIRTAAVMVFQSSGQFARWNPHWHGLFLEGGFDREGRFLHVPTVDLAKMSACFAPESHRVLPGAQAPERAAGQEHAGVDPQWF